jgi:predicted ArsR family transcriptional regulator
MATNGEETSVHRALAEERRARLVEELRGKPDGLDVEELSSRVGAHPNTVRWHLGILRDAGIVSSRPLERLTPGRPRIAYSLDPHAPAAGRDEHRLLAAMLAGAVSLGEDGPARSEQAGRVWGRCLVHRPPPFAHVDEGEAVGEVARVLDEQGFAPEVHDREVHMRRCPFHDLAEGHPQVVCAAHRGLISGALAELGSELEVAELDVFVRPDLCVARLAPRPASA